jgi:hypothetical protein
MNAVFRYFVSLSVCYLFSWTVAYALFMGSDFRYFFEFLAAAWTLRALELPTFIWLVSIAIFLVLAGSAVLILKRSKPRREDNAA